MSTRTKELIVLGVVLILSIIAYTASGTLEFSPTVSIIVVFLILAALIWILIRTIQGRLIDRRMVFLFVGFAIALPLFMTITQEIRVSPEVQMLYDETKALPAGSKVLISFDYDPPSAPELQPMAESFIRFALRQDLKIIIIGLWPQGPQQAEQALEVALKDPEVAEKNLQYGVDYVNLGFQTGNEFVIQRMGADFKSMFPRDYSGRNYDDIPLVQNVKNFSNIDFALNLSAGYPGTQEWVQVAVDRYGLDMAAGNTAVQAPMMYPYLRAGQLKGLLGGMNGAAEFETITGMHGNGIKYMLSQSFAHMVVIAFVIIGNVAFFMGGRKKKISTPS